jgi:hypothetical protein
MPVSGPRYEPGTLQKMYISATYHLVYKGKFYVDKKLKELFLAADYYITRPA